ncbi:MAG TPA: branched-chain amino acid ABC transporter permease [Methylomirabilota bacterium]|nr:branched-chain amino acid ABC transporter permease [Methylomirabilota bacterium]
MTAARTALGLGALFGALPWLIADYHRLFVAEILIWGLFAMSVGMVYGYGGMLSFAQAVFFGWGCWGYNVASFLLQWNTWGALALAMTAAAVFAVPIGYIATRVRQHHFLIVTVIVSVLVSAVLSSGHWRWMAGPYVTRSLTFVPEVPLGVVRLSYANDLVAYYFTLAVVSLAFAVTWTMVQSPWGRALLAQRDNESRAALIGLDVNRLRWSMFVLAAAVAGLAGALYALLARYTNLEFFDWTYSGRAVVMAVLGGTGSLFGPFLGTAAYMLTAEMLSDVMRQSILVFAALLLIVIRVAPDGLWGLAERLAARGRS